jgi:hypothetical protein
MGRPAIHPGEHLADLLHELDMSAAELSRQLKVPTNRVTAITQVALTRRERLIPQFPSASLRFLLPALYVSSAIISISTQEPNGSCAIPTALRA